MRAGGACGQNGLVSCGRVPPLQEHARCRVLYRDAPVGACGGGGARLQRGRRQQRGGGEPGRASGQRRPQHQQRTTPPGRAARRRGAAAHTGKGATRGPLGGRGFGVRHFWERVRRGAKGHQQATWSGVFARPRAWAATATNERAHGSSGTRGQGVRRGLGEQETVSKGQTRFPAFWQVEGRPGAPRRRPPGARPPSSGGDNDRHVTSGRSRSTLRLAGPCSVLAAFPITPPLPPQRVAMHLVHNFSISRATTCSLPITCTRKVVFRQRVSEVRGFRCPTRSR